MNDADLLKKIIAAAKLTIEIVPDTCVITRVRDHVEPADWEVIRAKTAALAANRCRVCGAPETAANRLESGELWKFEAEERKLTLVGLAAFCAACYRVTNIRRASDYRDFQFAVYHLAKINRWKEEWARFYIRTCYRTWDKRSESDWRMDLSYIKRNFSIAIKPPVMKK